MTSLPFCQFTASLELSRSRIPDVQPVKLRFSLIVTFYLTKTENRTKNSLKQSIAVRCSCLFFPKNADISKIKRALVRKWKLHMCAYLHAKFQVSSTVLTRFREEVILPPPSSPTSKRSPKKLTHIRVKTRQLFYHNVFVMTYEF